MPNTKNTRSIVDVSRDVQELRNEIHNLAAQLRTARGTGDVTAAAEQAVRTTTTAAQAPRVDPEIDGWTGAALYAEVRRLIAERPMRFRELMEALKLPVAGENRVKGALVRLQRERINVINLGTGRRALWFIPSTELLDRLVAMRGAK